MPGEQVACGIRVLDRCPHLAIDEHREARIVRDPVPRRGSPGLEAHGFSVPFALVTKLVVALAASLLLAPASAAGADRLPDAEVFAASTTDVITDPADPRLDVRL